ncbi:IS1 family transposase [Gloeothece citriformis]|uniref:IS1 family transposase n=1 Tax=Gloeothece citriformis TaxID=2546356 RepID=UPI0012FEB631|nr:IS1 family transposase [Gloeothece citriformis]
MSCPKCASNNIRKNGHRRGKQNHQCQDCGRQFIDCYSQVGYPKEVKENCLTMYVNGNGFRAIERITKVNHNTVIRWVRQVGIKLSNQKETSSIPDVAQLDELQTFVGKKKNKRWIWTSVDKDNQGILEYVIGDRSSDTFEGLWNKIKHWNCYFWITDGYKVYPNFIPDGDQIISKIYMTRVEGENSRLRHYLARLHRKTFCYSKSDEMLFLSVKLLAYYLKNKNLSLII